MELSSTYCFLVIITQLVCFGGGLKLYSQLMSVEYPNCRQVILVLLTYLRLVYLTLLFTKEYLDSDLNFLECFLFPLHKTLSCLLQLLALSETPETALVFLLHFGLFLVMLKMRRTDKVYEERFIACSGFFLPDVFVVTVKQWAGFQGIDSSVKACICLTIFVFWLVNSILLSGAAILRSKYNCLSEVAGFKPNYNYW